MITPFKLLSQRNVIAEGQNALSIIKSLCYQHSGQFYFCPKTVQSVVSLSFSKSDEQEDNQQNLELCRALVNIGIFRLLLPVLKMQNTYKPLNHFAPMVTRGILHHLWISRFQ